MAEKGIKFDNGKPMWHLLPMDVMAEVVDILTMGAKKYKAFNWQHVKPRTRYIDALYRHFTAWHRGEKIDPESGKNHLAHVLCNAIFLLWFDLNEGKDGK